MSETDNTPSVPPPEGFDSWLDSEIDRLPLLDPDSNPNKSKARARAELSDLRLDLKRHRDMVAWQEKQLAPLRARAREQYEKDKERVKREEAWPATRPVTGPAPAPSEAYVTKEQIEDYLTREPTPDEILATSPEKHGERAEVTEFRKVLAHARSLLGSRFDLVAVYPEPEQVDLTGTEAPPTFDSFIEDGVRITGGGRINGPDGSEIDRLRVQLAACLMAAEGSRETAPGLLPEYADCFAVRTVHALRARSDEFETALVEVDKKLVEADRKYGAELRLNDVLREDLRRYKEEAAKRMGDRQTLDLIERILRTCPPFHPLGTSVEDIAGRVAESFKTVWQQRGKLQREAAESAAPAPHAAGYYWLGKMRARAETAERALVTAREQTGQAIVDYNREFAIRDETEKASEKLEKRIEQLSSEMRGLVARFNGTVLELRRELQEARTDLGIANEEAAKEDEATESRLVELEQVVAADRLRRIQLHALLTDAGIEPRSTLDAVKSHGLVDRVQRLVKSRDATEVQRKNAVQHAASVGNNLIEAHTALGVAQEEAAHAKQADTGRYWHDVCGELEKAAEADAASHSRPENPPYLTPAEAVFGVLSWLTTRDEVITLGADNLCAPAADVAGLFCDVNKLGRCRNNWSEYLTHPPAPSSVEEEESGT